MAKTFAPPFRRPSPDRFEPETWVLDRGENTLEENIPNWDYQKNFRLDRAVTVDLDGIRDDCGLTSDSEVRLTAGYYCSNTRIRETGPPVDLTLEGTERHELGVEVEGQQLSQQFDIYTEMTLLKTGSSVSPPSPTKRGTRLWQNSRTLRLEGGASRFPVEVVSFESSGLPSRAGWRLDRRNRNLNSPVLGAIRLLVNADRERLVRAISEPDRDGETRAISDAIRYDVAKRLIETALNDTEFRDRFPVFPENSVGQALSDLIRIHLGEEGLEGIAAEAQNRPELFDATIQAALGIFDFDE